ncbi:MAG: hypothetical protein ACM3XR_12500 [Bacillota bacterium]
MKVEPVKTYMTPGYPEKSFVLRNPAILKSLPQRWKNNVKIGFALSSTIMMLLSACGSKMDGGGETHTGNTEIAVGTNESGPDMKKDNSLGRKTGLAIVAPIFSHGDGRGSFGCVSVAPPVFLSEAEAFEVISEEAKLEGIEFIDEPVELDGVRIPVTDLYPHPEDEKPEMSMQKGTLALDGYDKERKIAFEFVSRDDVVEWQQKNPGMMASVETYDALGAAEKLREGLENKTGGNTLALFYDPMGFDREIHDKYMEEYRKLADQKGLSYDEKNIKRSEIEKRYELEIKEKRSMMLREQVKDFLGWLKAQGII